MGHRLAPEAEAELDDIWYYITTESQNIDIADRWIDSITERFFLLATYPYVGRRRDEDLRPGLRSFAAGEYVSSTALEKTTRSLILHIVCGSRDLEALFRD